MPQMNMHVKEKIPKHPVFSFQVCKGDRDAEIPSLLDAGEVRYLNRGSMAIAYALQLCGVTRDDGILIPAYHCLDMVKPVSWVGAKPVFYRINEDTSLDLDDIRQRLTASIRALIAPHYFGFHQDMKAIRAFCDEYHLVLIEDCAHAFFGRIDGYPPGYHGDYAVGSAWKFFPVDEGACLVSSRGRLAGATTDPVGMFFEIKSLMNTLEYAVAYERLGVLNAPVRWTLQFKDALWRWMKPRQLPRSRGDENAARNGGDSGFDGNRIRQRNSRSSRTIIGCASKSRIVRNRRRNYFRLLSRLGNISGCRPLFGALPDDVVPHVFPLVMENPEKVFHRLKADGVPVIRFGEYLSEDMETGLCTVSEDYSRRVFQFPCHQDLKDEELDWMMDRIEEALR
jgi:perosamine synthetase